MSREKENRKEKLRLSFPLHVRVSENQSSHGLSLDDFYSRYRTYCTSKIRKLRRRNRLTSTNGRKKSKTKFLYSKIAKEEVADCGEVLEVVVLEAERGWAYGQQLRREYKENNEENARQRIRGINRLKKAVKKAKEVQSICQQVGDELLKIEGEVYCRWMMGCYEMAKEEWAKAILSFKFCGKIYMTLSKKGELGTKEMYLKKGKEVAEYLKVCQYWTKGDVEDDDGEEGDTNIRLNIILEQRKKEESKGGYKIKFVGKEIVLEDSRLKGFYGECVSVKKELSKLIKKEESERSTKRELTVALKSTETLLHLFDKLLATYRECLVATRDEERKEEKKGKKLVKDNLQLFHVFLQYHLAMDTVKRNEILVFLYERLVENTTVKIKKRAFKNIQVADIIRMFDLIMQNLDDVAELPMLKKNPEIVKVLEGKRNFYKTMNSYFLAKFYFGKNRYKEAYALFKRTEQYFKIAVQLEKLSKEDSVFLKQFVEANVEKEKAICSAKNYLFDSDALETSESLDLRKKGKIEILDDLNTYREVKRKNPFLVHFPPSFQKIPCKPIFFNVAGNYVEDVSKLDVTLDSKIKKKKWFGIF